MENNKKTRTCLNVTINGVCMDNDGVDHIINETFEGVNAINLDCFKWLADDKMQQDHWTMGGFSTDMWVKLLTRNAEVVGPEAFLMATMKVSHTMIYGENDPEKAPHEAEPVQKDIT